MSVGLTPSLASTAAWQTVQFTANVQGTSTDQSVTWSALVGTINSSGLYTAPSAAGTDTVTAISNANNAMSASSTVTITPGAPPNAVSLLHFGNAGFGGDDTNVLLTALNSTASSGQTLEIPAGNYNISPLTFPRNSNVFVDSGVTVSAIAGYATSAVMLNIDTGPVTITGAGSSVSVFQMPLALAASESDSSQFRHCLEIGQGGAASNVTISGIACNQSGGDGIYIRNATNVLGRELPRSMETTAMALPSRARSTALPSSATPSTITAGRCRNRASISSRIWLPISSKTSACKTTR